MSTLILSGEDMLFYLSSSGRLLYGTLRTASLAFKIRLQVLGIALIHHRHRLSQNLLELSKCFIQHLLGKADVFKVKLVYLVIRHGEDLLCRQYCII